MAATLPAGSPGGTGSVNHEPFDKNQSPAASVVPIPTAAGSGAGARVLAVGRNLYAVFTRSPRQSHLPGAECCYEVLAHPNSRYQKWLVSPRGSDWELATIRMVDGRSWASKPGRWI